MNEIDASIRSIEVVPRSSRALARPPDRPHPPRRRRSQVESLLADEPDNAEYLDVRESLAEVIALTEDLFASATTDADAAASAASADAAAPPPTSYPPPPPHASASTTAATDRAAATAAALMAYPPGATCQARYDGTWYDARIDRWDEAAGAVRVSFPAYGTVATVPTVDVRRVGPGGGAAGGADRGGGVASAASVDAGAEAAAGAAREVYKGVPAPKRLRVGGDVTEFVKKELPKKLIVLEGDDEATRERKRKQAKAFKGKQRMAEMDAEQNAKKSSWASFQSKVAGKKRTGFVSKKIGVKAKSMFSVGDGGRVGVVGSGSGMIAEKGERKRHEFDK